jgi:hypothetical protein
MTMIPGTNYQISGNSIQSRDGKEISQQQFLEKVQSKEISLTENSLQVLQSHVGPDMLQSLRSVSGFPSSPGSVSEKLTQTEGSMNDIYALMKLMSQVSQEQRKTMTEVRHAQTDMQVDAMQKSAQEQLNAANARLVAGIAGGILTMGSGVVGMAGAGGMLNDNLKVSMKLGESWGQLIDGMNKIIGAGIERGSQEHEYNSKKQDIEAKKYEDMSGESRDHLDTIRETHAKVKEILQALQNSENETQRSIARM